MEFLVLISTLIGIGAIIIIAWGALLSSLNLSYWK
jgi:hypothetical protein